MTAPRRTGRRRTQRVSRRSGGVVSAAIAAIAAIRGQGVVAVAALGLSIALCGGLAGCTDADDAGVVAAGVSPVEVSVDRLARGLAGGAVTAVDANSERTRSMLGVVPGAVMLSHYRTYDVSELPADKDRPLVFYCANRQCGSSHVAARAAVAAGYTDVGVMTAGIMGWKDAGERVARP